jgi:transposase-like protein
MKPDVKATCPFCGGEAVLRNPVHVSTQKKSWQRIQLAVPHKQWFCKSCKRTIKDPFRAPPRKE